MDQYIKGFWNTCCGQVLSLHDGLVCLSTANDIVRLHGEHFLQDIGCAERFQCPHFHFTETLPAELCLTAQRLLGNQGVGPDRTRVHFIINHVTQRSEEHTSELQSLMRNSYAVFCLNKKKQTKQNKTKQ